MHSEKMAATDMSFRQLAVIQFLVKEQTRQESHTSDFVVCMEMPALVPAVSESVNVKKKKPKTVPLAYENCLLG